MKKLFVFLLITILSLISCSKNKENNLKNNVQQSEKIKIILDWTPNTNHTGLFVAKELGYFKELGLDNVEIVQPPEGSTTALVGSGEGQFGISFQDTLAKAFTSKNPIPVTAVAAIIQHNTSGIISLKTKNIDNPKKMENTRYATWDDEIEKAMLKKIITDNGGDFNKVKLIPNTITDVVTALKTDIDAVWVYYAWDGIATKLSNLNTNFLSFSDYGKELDYYSPVIISNNNYLKTHPEEAKKVLSAIKKGYEYSINNPVEAAKILVKNSPEIDINLAIESQKWLSTKYKDDVTNWGEFSPERWNLFYNWLYENKLISQKIPENFGFSNEYLK